MTKSNRRDDTFMPVPEKVVQEEKVNETPQTKKKKKKKRESSNVNLPIHKVVKRTSLRIIFSCRKHCITYSQVMILIGYVLRGG